MKDKDVFQKLRSLELSELNQQKKEETLRKARYAFVNSEALASTDARPLRVFTFYRSVAVLAALVFVLVIPYTLKTTGPTDLPQSTVADRALLRELESLFPGELRAVVANGSAPEILLGEKREVRPTQPVVVEFDRGSKKYRVLTYSGESVDLPLPEGIRKFEVLVNGKGEVLVIGDDFVAKSGRRSQVGNYQVSARSIEGNI